MQIAMIGLGRMGANMAQRLLRGGHRVVGFDPAVDARKAIEAKGRGDGRIARGDGRETRRRRAWCG